MVPFLQFASLGLQVFSSDYESQSLQNSVLKEYIYPERGFIYDRNGTLIVENQPLTTNGRSETVEAN